MKKLVYKPHNFLQKYGHELAFFFTDFDKQMQLTNSVSGTIIKNIVGRLPEWTPLTCTNVKMNSFDLKQIQIKLKF